MSKYTPLFITAGLGLGAYLFYQEYLKATSQTSTNFKPQKPPATDPNAPADPQLLRRSMQVLEIYSKNYMESPNITNSLRHIIKLYTSEILKSKTLAQNLLADGIIDKLFSLLAQSKNPLLLIDIYGLLTNFLCTVTGDLPALIILRQEKLVEVGIQKGLQGSENENSENAGVQNACLTFLKNLTVRDDVLDVDIGMEILDEIMKMYAKFDTDGKINATSVINNALRSDIIGGKSSEFREAFSEEWNHWFEHLSAESENIESEKLATNLKYLKNISN